MKKISRLKEENSHSLISYFYNSIKNASLNLMLFVQGNIHTFDYQKIHLGRAPSLHLRHIIPHQLSPISSSLVLFFSLSLKVFSCWLFVSDLLWSHSLLLWSNTFSSPFLLCSNHCFVQTIFVMASTALFLRVLDPHRDFVSHFWLLAFAQAKFRAYLAPSALLAHQCPYRNRSF